jgi:hypothetical protein
MTEFDQKLEKMKKMLRHEFQVKLDILKRELKGELYEIKRSINLGMNQRY